MIDLTGGHTEEAAEAVTGGSSRSAVGDDSMLSVGCETYPLIHCGTQTDDLLYDLISTPDLCPLVPPSAQVSVNTCTDEDDITAFIGSLFCDAGVGTSNHASFQTSLGRYLSVRVGWATSTLCWEMEANSVACILTLPLLSLSLLTQNCVLLASRPSSSI